MAAVTAAPLLQPQNPQNNAENNSDVFSMTDDGLARRFQFQNEHGVGNWGSVWLASDKRDLDRPEADREKVAIKVVHRSKTQTTAARVRALWNEMKSVKSLRDNHGKSHPSVVNFDCFIITPSYALIVMEFLPSPLPLPVDEHAAKLWMASLASAVEFMHARGVVHNDIKPANILLSARKTPVLVDFGFSERYAAASDAETGADGDAPVPSPHGPFLSSLAYGTPEYLSPERAAGHVHDTRKADVWSLGVTFFEFIFARTPFEEDKTGIVPGKDDANDAITDKKAMDAYWARTVKGKWLGVGSGSSKLHGKMSVPLEALLRRMISPNADVRFTAAQVLQDAYWNSPIVFNPEKSVADKERVPKPKVLRKSGAPIVHGEPAHLQGGMANVVRTVLGNKGNAVSTGKSLATPVKRDGKENLVPRSPRVTAREVSPQPHVHVNAERPAVKMSKMAVEQVEEPVDSSLPVEQEAQRVREIAADTRVDRMAIWVKNVERVVEDAKKTIARSDSQPLPPLPSVLTSVDSPPDATSKLTHASPSSSGAPAAAPPRARRRANDPFAPSSPTSPNQRRRRAVAIGNSADLSGPVQTLRHTVSADYPFNTRTVDGAKVPAGHSKAQSAEVGDGVKVVLSRPEIRKIKSDLAAGRGLHARTLSYNTMYLRQAGPPPVAAIPEVRVEDTEDQSKTPPPAAPTESFYDKLIVSTNAVERIGKGYQSNLCVQNNPRPASRKPSAYAPPPPCINANGERIVHSVKRKLSASNFFLSMRGERPCSADGAPASAETNAAALPLARPRRKIRQAASLDGFRNFARPEKEKPAAPRPVSEHIRLVSTPTPTPDQQGVVKVGKKRSTVTKTMRKAFLAFIGGSHEKAN